MRDEDLWSDEICALVDAGFDTVSRNPSDHETAVAYRKAIASAHAQGYAEAKEQAAKVCEGRVDIGMKSTGVVNNALLQALPDAIRAMERGEV